MDNDKEKVNEEFSFNSFQELSMRKYQEALEAYEKNLSNAISLKSLPIFMDSNVILHPYKISTVAKNKLNEFFQENRSRIFITKQVQSEFLENRENVLENNFLTVLGKLPSSFEKEVVNSISNFINSNEKILDDYNSIQERLKEIEQECKKLQVILEKQANEIRNANKNIKFTDEILNTYCSFNFISNLSSEETDFIRKQFDSLRETKEDKVIFPGKGDIKNKDNPHGDYIILHELLKYAKEQQTDVIFLTMDKKKGDWIKPDGQPYIEYIKKSFLLTKRVVYILDAERVLSEVLKVSLEDVVDKKNNLLNTADSFLSSLSRQDFEKLVRELVKAELSEVATNNSEIEIIESDSDDSDFMTVVHDPFQYRKILVTAKQYSNLGKISLSTVERLYRTVVEEKANLGTLITDSYYTKEAYNFAASNQDEVVLLDRENLSELLIKHGYI